MYTYTETDNSIRVYSGGVLAFEMIIRDICGSTMVVGWDEKDETYLVLDHDPTIEEAIQMVVKDRDTKKT